MPTKYAIGGPCLDAIKKFKEQWPRKKSMKIVDACLVIRKPVGFRTRNHNGAELFLGTRKAIYSVRVSSSDMSEDFKISSFESWTFGLWALLEDTERSSNMDMPPAEKTFRKTVLSLISNNPGYYGQYFMYQPVVEKRNDFYA